MSHESYQDELMVITPRSSSCGKSAYAYAVEGGYLGTEEEFAQRLAFLMNGAVAGYLEDNAIILCGDLAPGTYTFAYLVRKSDGTTETATIGTYTVEDESETKTYTITWVVDGNTTTETYEAGATPTFKGSTDKATDDTYDYTFAGWSPAISAVSGDKTYTAQYTQSPKNWLKAVGYNVNTRVSSSQATAEAALQPADGACASNLIPVTDQNTYVYIKNVTLSSADSINNVGFYDADGNRLYGAKGTPSAWHSSVDTISDGLYRFKAGSFTNMPNLAYILFSCGVIDENSVVTIGMEPA